jgi:hypothetical protein
MGARSDLLGDPPPCDASLDGFGGQINFPHEPGKGEEIWYRVRIKFTTPWDWDTDGTGMKLLRLYREDPSNNSKDHFDLYIDDNDHQPYLSGEATAPDAKRYVGTISDAPTLDAWQSWEMYVMLDNVPESAGGTAKACVWRDSALLGCITDEATLRDATDTVAFARLNTYWNGACEQPVANQTVFYDDIEIRTKRPSVQDSSGNYRIGP